MITHLKRLSENLHIEWQFIKFLFVGFINTVFGYSIYAICIFIGMHYTVATLISTVLGILFNFKTTGNIVFKNNDNKLIFRFFFVYGLVYLFTIGCLNLLTLLGFYNMYINYALILPFNVIMSYLLMKKFVFNVKK